MLIKILSLISGRDHFKLVCAKARRLMVTKPNHVKQMWLQGLGPGSQMLSTPSLPLSLALCFSVSVTVPLCLCLSH